MRFTAALLAALALPTSAWPCSTFSINRPEAKVFGQNYDWAVGEGAVFVNKRGLAKKGFGNDNPPTWTSRYGSVTFNQYGREFPNGGMNEEGLVVAVMWLNETQYPRRDARHGINLLQWVQYQLDNAKTVEEVLGADEKLRVTSFTGAEKLHYLVSDASGRAATIEILGGRMVVHDLEEKPAVLTNSVYAACLRELEQYTGFGGTAPLPSKYSGADTRFVRGAAALARLKADSSAQAVDRSFSMLQDLAQGSFTKWSIVYDQKNRQIHFHTLEAPDRRTIDFKPLDFSCATPVQVLDMNQPLSGDVTARLKDYTREFNQNLVSEAFSQTPFLNLVPASILKVVVAYPEGAVCAAQQQP